MAKAEIEKIVEEIFLKLKDLPSGTKISTCKLLGEGSLEKYSTSDLFEIDKKLMEKCKEEKVGLKLYSGVSGLPFNLPFTKE